MNLTSRYLVDVFVPPGARHYRNVADCNVLKQRLEESQFACFMVAKAQAQSQNLADSVVQQQRLLMSLKHERNVSTGQKISDTIKSADSVISPVGSAFAMSKPFPLKKDVKKIAYWQEELSV